jgi:hypothetical protein
LIARIWFKCSAKPASEKSEEINTKLYGCIARLSRQITRHEDRREPALERGEIAILQLGLKELRHITEFIIS